MTQTGLITKILEATHMTECSPNYLPTSSKVLVNDNDGPAYTGTWNYASIFGMLLNLTSNTRPDISFTVSQVARYNPMLQR